MMQLTDLVAFEEEEREMSGDLSKTIEKSYSSKALWFFHALDSTNAVYRPFELQLRPQFISKASQRRSVHTLPSFGPRE
jgi:hypothetical protein